MIFEACKVFLIDQQKTPIFLFGRSFGGLLATNMANDFLGKSMLTGVCLLTPYYRLWTEKLYDLQPLFKFANYIAPYKLIKPEFKELEPEVQAKWGHIHDDPNCDHRFTPTTGVMWAKEQIRAKTSIQQTPVPLIVIEAVHDAVVRNDLIFEYAQLAHKQAEHQRAQKSKIANKYVRVKDCDHTTVCFDAPAVKTVITETVSFFDRLIEEKNKGSLLFWSPL